MKMNPLLLTDFYKVGHVFQYPPNTTLVYSNLTPRKSRLEGIDQMVLFGLQYFIKEYLIEQFNTEFFNRPKEVVLHEYKVRVERALGQPLPSYEHIGDLHDLGYLPIMISSTNAGSLRDDR
jgi:nicotinamide phosphoribosyltransferase